MSNPSPALTRRTFLRVLGSAAIGVAVAQAIPFGPPVYAETTSVMGAASMGPLTFAMLEQAYLSCVIGRESPTMGMLPASMARRVGLVYDVEVEDA